jgi:hypothetical protein
MLNPLSRITLFKERKCHINLQVRDLMNHRPTHVGPFLQIEECIDRVWKANVLVVHLDKINIGLSFDSEEVDDAVEPDELGPSRIKRKAEISYPIVISQEHGYTFTKFLIQVDQSKEGVRMNYVLRVGSNDAVSVGGSSFVSAVSAVSAYRKEKDQLEQSSTRSFPACFFVPGYNETWRWVFFSCNDLSHTSGYNGYAEKYGGIVPLWSDLIHKHDEHNYHLMVGLGDQVYLDEVFEHVKLLSDWTFFSNREQREHMACPEKLLLDVDEWSFFYYLRHFSQAYFEKALSTIPHLFVMSDHDTYDGQGSYPEELENSPVLSSTRKILQKYYLLFQQHQDPMVYFGNMNFSREEHERYKIDQDIFGDSVTPCVRQMGDRMSILALDTRFERTKKEIISKRTYDWIFSRLEKVHKDTRHLIVATEIPLIFPDVRFAEKILERISKFKRGKVVQRVMRKIRMFKVLGLPFGEPLLLTDMVDHWNSVNHIDERNAFIFRLQEFSKRRSIRVTFIGGDVHTAGVGRFATPSENKDKLRKHYENNMMLPPDFKTDHRLMYQIISSAIANVPPPGYIIKFYHMIDRAENITGPDKAVTQGKMMRLFLRDTKGRVFGKSAKKLLAQRNFCAVQMSTIDDSLFFELYLELYLGAGKTTKFSIVIPRLHNGGIFS